MRIRTWGKIFVERVLETVFNGVSIAVFVCLIALFLQRSMSEGEPRDKIWHYGPPAIGCALANQIGYAGFKDQSVLEQIFAVAVLVAVVGYIFHILQPFARD